MLKGKEVIADPQKQYELARSIHLRSHGGINKTTASIAESYHWVRIKETVSQVIRNCSECNELNKNVLHRQPTQPIYRAGESGPDAEKAKVEVFREIRAVTAHKPRPIAVRNSHVPLPRDQREQREESPGAQLQMEASQAQAQAQQQSQQMPYSWVALDRVQIPHPYGTLPQHYQTYSMPVDPAIMQSNQHMNLQDLPPSPFLAASQSSGPRNLPALAMAPPVANMTGPSGNNGAMAPYPSQQNVEDEVEDVQMGEASGRRLLPRKATLRRGLRPTRGRD